jgi:hypothetical protein
MADQKPAERPAPQSQAKKDPPAPLGDAGASTNPLVHQLLAERAIAVSNGDENAVDAVDGRLAELGVK